MKYLIPVLLLFLSVTASSQVRPRFVENYGPTQGSPVHRAPVLPKDDRVDKKVSRNSGGRSRIVYTPNPVIGQKYKEYKDTVASRPKTVVVTRSYPVTSTTARPYSLSVAATRTKGNAPLVKKTSQVTARSNNGYIKRESGPRDDDRFLRPEDVIRTSDAYLRPAAAIKSNNSYKGPETDNGYARTQNQVGYDDRYLKPEARVSTNKGYNPTGARTSPDYSRASLGAATHLRGLTTGNRIIDSYIVDSSQRYSIDPLLIYSQMSQESSFKPHATSNKGASGLMQLMPATAKRMGVKNIYDPQQNIEGGVKYMRLLLDMFEGDINLALAGYNAGEAAVIKYGHRIPPFNETQDYVQRISARYRAISKSAVAENYSRTHNP